MTIDDDDVIYHATNAMSSQKVKTFNAQFTMYEGTKKGAEIKGLFNMVEASNTVNDSHQVSISGVSLSEIKSTVSYNVSLNYDDEGYIDQISIIQN